MASITVRDIPDDIYHAIAQAAELNHRSINKEIIAGLEKSFLPHRISVEEELRQLDELHARIGTIDWTDEQIDAAKREGRE
jgi:hypothetical protein